MLASYHSFLDFHGKVALVGTMTNLLDFPMIFIGVLATHTSNLSFFFFFYIDASFTTFFWFGIDSELGLFLWLIHRRLSHDFLGFSTVTRTLEP